LAYPFHFEVRIDGEQIVPIEMNPLRFAGWCTTDIAYYAYGINTYKCFFHNKKPDWETVFEENSNIVYAMVIMDKTMNNKKENLVFEYNSLKKYYSEIIEIRKVDYKIHSIYGFMFLKIRDEKEKIFDKILKEEFDRFLK
jgi:hypothetical protein